MTKIQPSVPNKPQIPPPLDINGRVVNPRNVCYVDPNSDQINQLGQIAAEFKWKDSLLDPAKIDRQFQAFCRQKSFPVEADMLSTMVADSFSLADEVYKTLFGNRGCPLPYHDIAHAKLTGAGAIKLFLGGLVGRPDILTSLQQVDQLSSVIRTFLITSTLHEVDDWLTLPGVSDQSRLSKAKQVAVEHLHGHGLSPFDFDQIILLDNFAGTPLQSLKAAMRLTPGQGFLSRTQSTTQGHTILQEQQELLDIAQKSLQAADFLQIANPAYYQQVHITDGDQHLTCNLSMIALCWEMITFRPQAIVSEWTNRQDNIDMAKLVLSSYFVNQVAMPRISPGLGFLKVFDEGEYHRAIQSISMLTNIN